MPEAQPLILVADDDRDVLEALKLLLRSEGYGVEAVTSPSAVLGAVASREFAAALVDMNYTRDTTGGAEGLDLLARLQLADATLPVVVMTAWGSIEGAVEAIHRGARDYVEKPFNNARLLHVLRTQVELGQAIRRTHRLEVENLALRRTGAPKIVAASTAMQGVLRLVARIAPSDASALISGEHGTGKEVIAQWIHASSARSARAMITVNVGGLAEGVFEAELFGHVKGAYTDAKSDRVGRFELADGGTLFLDEIANLTMSQQSRLLRVLQAGELERVGSSRTQRVDVRVLAATNANLRDEVAAGRFREDLFFRLNTVEINIPPLRDRRDDIPALAAYFLGEFGARYRKPGARFSAGAMQALLDYRWPGNVRELAHAVERAVLLADGDEIGTADLALRSAGDGAARLDELSLEDVERVLITKAMARHGGNVAVAAKALGLSRSALYRRLQRHEL